MFGFSIVFRLLVYMDKYLFGAIYIFPVIEELKIVMPKSIQKFETFVCNIIFLKLKMWYPAVTLKTSFYC